MFKIESILERKSILFSAICVSIIAILALPVIIPHILHGYHIIHIFLHIGGIILAVFITVLSLLAYRRIRTKRLMLSSCAFGNLILAESVLIIDATWPTLFDIEFLPLAELGHLLTFITLGLLGLAVFKNE